ncbi:MAG: (2Fe-2S)-binding protein [Nitrospinota bacterium]
MKQMINLTVNGEKHEVMVEQNKLLTDVLRDQLQLTGTKVSCEMGACGTCTVLVGGLPVSACLMLAVQADGEEIETIEGLASEDGLHPVQRAFLDHGAVQCGFCIPGMIMTAKAYLQEKRNPTEAEISEELKGNLCRCTGYVKIIKAIREAARLMG